MRVRSRSTPATGPPRVAAAARAADWDFTKFYPQSCIDEGLCDAEGQQTGIIQWRLDNDSTIREAFYETDADATNRGFASTNTPGAPVGFLTQTEYRDIILTEHGLLNAAHPDRYKRFIISGDTTHTALRSNDRYYTYEANGVPLHQWTNDFVKPPGNRSVWVDLVEELRPGPLLNQEARRLRNPPGSVHPGGLSNDLDRGLKAPHRIVKRS